MVEIKNISDKNEWNLLLAKNTTYSVFSSFEWGEYKKMSGWTVERLAFYNSGNFLGQCQFIYKRKYNLLFAWNSGGMHFTNISHLSVIIEMIKEHFGSFRFYLRFNFYNPTEGSSLFHFYEILHRPKKFINSNFSISHSLIKQSDILRGMSSNHRYYYKQAIKNNLSFQINSENCVKDFLSVHDNMTQSKGLSHLKINPNDLTLLLNSFKKSAFIFTVYFENNPVSSCLVLLSGTKAFYYLAGSSIQGRKLYASYYMIKELLEYLISIDIEHFDFGGITPYKKNAHGVNTFKIGFGGDITNYLGEWEISNSSTLSFLINKVYL